MSGKISGQVWDLAIPHNEAWVLMAIADHSDHEGKNVYPGMELIAWKTNLSVRTVSRMFRSLVEKGILVEQSRGGEGRGFSVYDIELSAAPLKPPRKKKRGNRTNCQVQVKSKPDNLSGAIGQNPINGHSASLLHETSLEGAAQSSTSPPATNQSSLKDRIYNHFKKWYEHNYELPYIPKKNQRTGDFVQLDTLIKAYPNGTLEQLWPKAVKNYFATPQKSHTLADICVNFATFQLHALDEYTKPVGGNGKKPSGPPTEEELRLAEDERLMKEHFKRIEERKKNVQPPTASR